LNDFASAVYTPTGQSGERPPLLRGQALPGKRECCRQGYALGIPL